MKNMTFITVFLMQLSHSMDDHSNHTIINIENYQQAAQLVPVHCNHPPSNPISRKSSLDELEKGLEEEGFIGADMESISQILRKNKSPTDKENKKKKLALLVTVGTIFGSALAGGIWAYIKYLEE